MYSWLADSPSRRTCSARSRPLLKPMGCKPFALHSRELAMSSVLSLALTPPRWSAVVRGAAAKGLDGDGRTPIKARKCRRNYGTGCHTLFVPGKHREMDAFISSYTGEKRADSQMSWLVKKGQDLSTSEQSHATREFGASFWEGDDRKTSIYLLASDADKAALRSTDKVSFHCSLPYANHEVTSLVCLQACYLGC